MKKMNPLIIALAMMSLVACGTTKSDRALSGAGIGAGVGAVAGAVTGGGIGTGAVVGWVVGGAAGALINKKNINLGKPVWE